ncbi:Glucosidase II alpha-subunit [Operophtera brumata]|uniref:Glucosidase II alpha-subunit n=1 Tax=Operophtera brumata TaxID=104452 RepID=A0A0L7LBU0_OPEBR|nr:Glucosidase II alpha-subunit [Operophtera brumata]
MVANLTAKGRKLVVIVDPHIKREAGYFVHEDCLEKGYYIKDKDGKVFNGPEITMPKDCRHYKPPQDGQEGLAYAAVWTGDNSAEWGHLAVTVPMCLSLSAAGISFCGADVGGFFKYPEHELMTRWYQTKRREPWLYEPSTTALLRDANRRRYALMDFCTTRREPWLYEPSTTALLRDANRRRYALMDFWYTLFYEHSIDGNKLLIKPVVEPGATSVKVYLPGADSSTLWYDVDTYQAHPAAGYLNQPVTISKRGGSIVPRKERIRRSSALMANDPFTLVITLDTNGTAEGTLYIDDGETFVNDKAHYPTRAWLERIVIAGIKAPPKTAKLTQKEKTTALQMTLHKGNNVLVVRKPAASMAQPWSITFGY